ncbi:unnamed protein product [Bursaphelenchus okinawaensis]|uniref:Uncharacterized protein n=1 Tax=Bursaphelenchus okinawaensis TaxID=465554 RepID=A0A811LR81_9BILA|nr:unnamed protein product [Bursaphelenchus okinawaensis]CAG9126485.1 unnamed protein product [Bursaphelenchus okinawaensis]
MDLRKEVEQSFRDVTATANNMMEELYHCVDTINEVRDNTEELVYNNLKKLLDSYVQKALEVPFVLETNKQELAAKRANLLENEARLEEVSEQAQKVDKELEEKHQTLLRTKQALFNQ